MGKLAPVLLRCRAAPLILFKPCRDTSLHDFGLIIRSQLVFRSKPSASRSTSTTLPTTSYVLLVPLSLSCSPSRPDVLYLVPFVVSPSRTSSSPRASTAAARRPSRSRAPLGSPSVSSLASESGCVALSLCVMRSSLSKLTTTQRVVLPGPSWSPPTTPPSSLPLNPHHPLPLPLGPPPDLHLDCLPFPSRRVPRRSPRSRSSLHFGVRTADRSRVPRGADDLARRARGERHCAWEGAHGGYGTRGHCWMREL